MARVGAACAALVMVGAIGCSSSSPGSGAGGSTGHGGAGGSPTAPGSGAGGNGTGGMGGTLGSVGSGGQATNGAGGATVGGAGGTAASGAGGTAVSGAGGTAVSGAGGTAGSGTAGGPGTGGAGGTSDAGTAGAAGQGQTSCPIPSGPAGTWVEIPAPSGQSGFHASDAFAVGQDDLFIAGNSGSPPANAGVLRWTRGCWSVELAIPAGMTAPDMPSVHGTGPDDLWASASDVLYHRDAQGWAPFADQTWRSMVRSPPSYAGKIEFRRVRAAAPGDFWIAASSNILHWGGQSWTTYNFDDPSYPTGSASIGYNFYDIWIDSPGNVWVGGPSDEVGNTMSLGFVHHFDGTNWTHTPTGVDAIYAMWRGGSVLWLAQPSPEVINGQEVEVTLRAFTGTSAPGVQIAGVDPTTRSVLMTSLFGHGAGDIWAAGEDVAHFDGQSWSLLSDTPAPARSDTDFMNTLVTGDAASVWVVTPGPRFFRKVTGP